MRVIWAELYKTVARRAVLAVLGVLLFFNASLIYTQSQTEFASSSYQNALDYLNTVPSVDRLQFLENHLQTMLGLQIEEPSIQFGNNRNDDWQITRVLLEEQKRIDKYPAYLREIEAKVRKSNISIFKKTSPYAMSDAKNVSEAYRGLLHVRPQMINSRPVLEVIESPFVSLFTLAFIGFIIISMVVYEKQQGLFRLYRTTPKGRISLALAKIIVSLALAIGSTLLFYITALGISLLKNGAVVWSAPIQSLSGYNGSALAWSIGKYMAIFICTKSVVFSLFALMILAVALKAKQTVAIYFNAVIIGAISFGMNALSPSNQLMAFPYYLNLIKFIKVYPFYLYYHNLNVLGTPISANVCSWVTLIVAILICALLILKIVSDSKFDTSWRSTKLRMSRGIFAYRISVKLWVHEIYKAFIAQRALIAIILLIVLQITMVHSYKFAESEDEYIYRQYMNVVSGPITQQTHVFMAQEDERFAKVDVLRKDINERLKQGAITDTEHTLAMSHIAKEKQKQRIYNEVKENIAHVEVHEDKGYSVMYEKGYLELLGKGYHKYYYDYITAIIMMLFIIITCASVFTYDEQVGLKKLIRTMPNGQIKMNKLQLGVGFTLAIIIFVTCQIPRAYAIIKHFGLTYLATPVGAIRQLSDSKLEMLPLWSYLLLVIVIRLVMALFIVKATQLVAAKTKRLTTTIGLVSAVAIVPLVLEFLGLELMPFMSINALLLASPLLGDGLTAHALLQQMIPILAVLALIMRTKSQQSSYY